MNKSAIVTCGLIALVVFASGADAALPYVDAGNHGVLDQVLSLYKQQMRQWTGPVRETATFIFMSLCTISLVLRGVKLATQQADIGAYFAEFIRFILFFGFYYWLLRNGTAISKAIIDSMMKLGALASGGSAISPSGVVDVGYKVFKLTINSTWVTIHPLDSFAVFCLGVAILMLLTAVGLNMLKLLVASYFWMYAGFFYTGFGGSDWTSDMAIGYFKDVLNIGVQLFIITLIVGIGQTTLDLYYQAMITITLTLEDLGVMLVFCFVLLSLSTYLPGLIASVVGGNAAGGLANSTPGQVASSVAGAVAGTAGGASAIMAAVKEGQALQASSGGGGGQGGNSSAQDYAKGAGQGGSTNGGGQGDNASVARDFYAKAAAGQGGTAGGGGAKGGGQGGGGQSGAAKGGGQGGGGAKRVGSILAQGAFDALTADTTGGKIASAINARGRQARADAAEDAATQAAAKRAQDEPSSPSFASFGRDSLAAGEETPRFVHPDVQRGWATEEEVAADQQRQRQRAA